MAQELFIHRQRHIITSMTGASPCREICPNNAPPRYQPFVTRSFGGPPSYQMPVDKPA